MARGFPFLIVLGFLAASWGASSASSRLLDDGARGLGTTQGGPYSSSGSNALEGWVCTEGALSPAVPPCALWVARYNGSGNSWDSASALGVSPDGSRIFVTGESRGVYSYDYATIAYDPQTGAELWVARYDGLLNDYARALAVSPDGTRVFVTGTSWSNTSVLDFATIAYDARTGTQVWMARYNGPANERDEVTAIAVSPDGTRVFVTGTSWSPTSLSDFATIAYDARTGTQLWVARYNGSGNGEDSPSAIAVSPDGNRVYVTGTSWRISCKASDKCSYNLSFDYATIAYDARTGAELWASFEVGDFYDRYSRYYGNDYGRAVVVSPDGLRVYVTGESFEWHYSSSRCDSSNRDSDYDIVTVAYNARTGERLWRNQHEYSRCPYSEGLERAHEYARSIAVARDGSRLFVTGLLEYGGSDYLTIAYDAGSGSELWFGRYDGKIPQSTLLGSIRDDVRYWLNVVPNRYVPKVNDNPQALVVSPDGFRVYVTGYSNDDYATVAYDARTGSQLWAARWTGEGLDSASALGISPDGSRIFVTGGSWSRSSSADFVTLAYDAFGSLVTVP